ncbi:MAG TPA: ankyrin repeat domain-containing protein [Stenomitos sp.]
MDFSYFHLDTLFHRSAFFGDQVGLEYAFELGLDINSRISLAPPDYCVWFTDLTPLMLAAWSTAGATVETLYWLVEHGADPLLRSAAKYSAAWYAIANPSWWNDPEQHQKNDRLSRLNYFLGLGTYPFTEEQIWNDRTLLTEACNVGDPDCVAFLLEAGMLPDPSSHLEDEWRSSYDIPLFCAAGSGSGSCVSLLLRSSADVHIRDNRGWTALMYAASVAVAEILIEAGIDLYAIADEHSRSKLLLEPAIDLSEFEYVEHRSDALDCILESRSAERSEIAAYLIQAGLDIDRNTSNINYRYTRLYDAAFDTNEFAVDFLLKNGANPHLRSFRGTTPLHAVCWGCDDSFKINWKPIQKTIRIIQQLLDAGINVNIADDLGYTPIHEAVFGDGGYLTALKTLLENGADANALTNHKTTPLMLAAMEGELECMQNLLANGADMTKVDIEGKTAADYAIEHYETLLKEGNRRYEGSPEYLLQRALGCIWLLK